MKRCNLILHYSRNLTPPYPTSPHPTLPHHTPSHRHTVLAELWFCKLAVYDLYSYNEVFISCLSGSQRAQEDDDDDDFDDDDNDRDGFFLFRRHGSVCKADSDDLIAHPDNCARYYNCSSNPDEDWWGENVRECPYPWVFSQATMRCQPHETVDCASRAVPLDPCE